MDKYQYFLKSFYILFASFLVLGLACSTGTKEKAGQIAEHVRTKISVYYPGDFLVTSVKKGSVRIEGQVESLSDKIKILEITSRVNGVKEIINDIVVKTSNLSDSQLEQNVLQELRLISNITEPDRIKVSVDKGAVTLTGEVHSYNEKLAVQTAVSLLKGVKDLENNIIILSSKQEVVDKDLKEIILGMIKFDFPGEKNVTVNVVDGVVTISGTVHRFWEKMQVEKDIHRIIGVKKVINQLKVFRMK